MKYSSDKKVCFDPQWNSYTMLGGKKLVSVSALIGKFKNKFDSDTFSKKAAEKRGVMQQVILDEWKAKANKSIAIGNAIHKIFEDYAEGKYSLQNGELCFDFLPIANEYFLDFIPIKNAALRFIKEFFETGRLKIIATEFIVYSDSVAGRVDIYCQDKEGKLWIFDFKTGKIETNSYGKKMLSVLSSIDDCSFNHYAIQLNLFSRMNNDLISGIYIVHITETYKLIPVSDVLGSLSVDDLFNAYKSL